MAGIKDYSTTAANNTSVGGISIAEGMLPSNINNAFRAVTADIREWYNDSQWVQYGDGDGSFTATYASGTSFTITGADVSTIYHEGRRIKVVAATPGTIYGTISSSSFSTDTTVNVTWDSGSLSNEAITSVFIGALSQINPSIPENSIDSANLKTDAVTTQKITNASITAAKLAGDSITTSAIAADAVTNAKIADDAVDSDQIADGAVDTVHIADANVTTTKIADSAITTAKLGADSVTNAKIADDSIDSEHYVDGSIDTAHIGDSQITTAKINDNAVTADKIADEVIVTNAEHSAHTPDDTSFFTTSASDARYFRQDSTETISSGDSWSSSDSYVATTAAIDARVVDLVDEVGGFVPIANETSFPESNSDINDAAGTIISIKEIATTRTPVAGTVTITNGAGSNTVTINGCGSTVLTAGFGVLVETTSTLHTYNFHRLTPKATEVTTVASISSDITTVANDGTDIGVVSGLSSDIQTLADIEDGTTATNAISNVGNNISDVTAVSSNLSGSDTIGTVATDLSGSNNIGTVAGSIANVNSVGGSIANVNTVATNIASVNNFGEVYRISSSAPTTSLDVGDLYFDTTDNVLKVYSASGWQNAGSSVNGTSRRYKYTATASQTTFSGTDDNGETLEYDAGFIDVYLNGVHLDPSDYTATTGTSIVLSSGATVDDELYVVAFGTFSVSDISGSDITSGTINNARLVNNGAITINGSDVALGGSVTIGETKPTITSISPDTITNDATSIVITGTNFVITPNVEIINSVGGITYPNSITRDSATQLTINVTLPTDGTYFIRVENPDGLAVRSSTALLTVSDAPTWSTTAGSLGSLAQGGTASFSVSASSDSTVAYSVTTGALPTGLSLNSSTGAITGTESGTDSAETTYNFTVTATDQESQTTDRAFSITVTTGINNGGQFN